MRAAWLLAMAIASPVAAQEQGPFLLTLQEQGPFLLTLTDPTNSHFDRQTLGKDVPAVVKKLVPPPATANSAMRRSPGDELSSLDKKAAMASTDLLSVFPLPR